MAHLLRCNVFQLAAPEPGLFRLSLAEIATRFDECAKMMAVLMNGDVELALATGPLVLTIAGPGLTAPGVSDMAVLRKSILRLPDFAALRHQPGFGAIHVCFLQNFEVEPDPRGGGLSYTHGFADPPFLYTKEYREERLYTGDSNKPGPPRWLVLLHEFGHLLLRSGHVEADGNLMSDKNKALNITDKQRKKMVRVARRIASGGRCGLWH
jgi:hypothetical protein